jgi:DNA invertase Pin-like site-specific DNA recombinase
MVKRGSISSVPNQQPLVIGYVRVSQAREEMISPELQRTAIEDFCHRRGYVLADIVEDLDATGRNFARAGIQHCLGMVESGEVAAIVVWKFSRFGRHRRDWAINLDRVESVGGALLSATEQIDTTTSTGRLTRGMLAEIAAWESERIGEQWKETQERRRKLGLTHNGGARVGYAIDENGHYFVDEVLRPLIVEAYRMYVGGASQWDVANWLNNNGVKNSQGRLWGQRTLSNYLESGFAAGLLHTYTPDAHYPGTHDPIINKLMWEQYLRARRMRRKVPPHAVRRVTELSGLIFCASCGGRLASTANAGKKRQLRCQSSKKKQQCDQPIRTVRYDNLLQSITQWLFGLSSSIDARADIDVTRSSNKIIERNELKRLNREILKLDESLTRLTVDLANGLVPSSAYAAARDEILTRKNQLQVTVDSMSQRQEQMRKPLPANLQRDWALMDMKTKNSILRTMIDHIEVSKSNRSNYSVTIMSTWGELFNCGSLANTSPDI